MRQPRPVNVESLIEAAARLGRRVETADPSSERPHPDATSHEAEPALTAGPFLDRLPDVMPRPRGPVEAAALAHDSVIAEESRLLQARLRTLGEKRRLRCIGIVSPTPREGKTTVALGLATALARQPGQRVLLIEADLRQPSVETYLGVPHAPGLAEWLGGSDSLSIRAVAPPGFSLISSGGATSQRHPERLGSRRMRGLLDVVRQSFELVIIDCPPLAPVADTVLLQDMVDGFLLVVRSGHCSRDAVARAVARLKPGCLLGTVFNDDRTPRRGYDGYGY